MEGSRIVCKQRCHANYAGETVEVGEEMAEPESQYGGGQDNDPLQPKHSPADTAAGAETNLDVCNLC